MAGQGAARGWPAQQLGPSAATLALISLTFADERERNLAIAVWGCISIIGSAIGPIVGGVLLAHFWWGSVFLINVPIVLLAMVGAVLFAPHGTPDASKPWDLISSLLSLVALSADRALNRLQTPKMALPQTS